MFFLDCINSNIGLILIVLGLAIFGSYFLFRGRADDTELTLEASDPQSLIDSEFELRDSVINEFINAVLLNFNVAEGEAQIKQFQPSLNFMIVKITFADYLITCSIDFDKKTYTLHLNYCCAYGDNDSKVVIDERVFKMNKTNWSVNFADVAKFINDFESTVLDLGTFDEIVQYAATIARDSKLVELPEDTKYKLLYDAVEHMSNILATTKNKNLKRQLLAPYIRVMSFICSNEKTKDMIDYLKMTPEEVDEQTETTEPAEAKEEE